MKRTVFSRPCFSFWQAFPFIEMRAPNLIWKSENPADKKPLSLFFSKFIEVVLSLWNYLSCSDILDINTALKLYLEKNILFAQKFCADLFESPVAHLIFPCKNISATNCTEIMSLFQGGFFICQMFHSGSTKLFAKYLNTVDVLGKFKRCSIRVLQKFSAHECWNN